MTVYKYAISQGDRTVLSGTVLVYFESSVHKARLESVGRGTTYLDDAALQAVSELLSLPGHKKVKRKQKEIVNAAKKRWEIAYLLRQHGLTYQKIGDLFHVTNERARQMVVRHQYMTGDILAKYGVEDKECTAS